MSVGQSRQDEVLLHQQQQHSALTQQAVSPGSVFYQHSPSASDVNAGDNHNQNQDDNGASSGPNGKYGECQTNGHDTLSDFVTFVCQETEQGQNQNHRNSPKSQQYPQYNTMLPPPPLPPMARPVAIIRSSDLTMVNSPPTSISPPTTMSSPHQEHQDSHMNQNDVNQSPPLSPQSQMERKGLTRITSPYSNGRDYTFNHFHSPQAQVSIHKTIESSIVQILFTAFQLSQLDINDVWCDQSNQFESLLNPSDNPADNSTQSMEQSVLTRRRFQHDDASRFEQQPRRQLSDSDGRRSRLKFLKALSMIYSKLNHSQSFLDRFFQTSAASSDPSTAHMNHGLIVASTAAITCTSDHSSNLNSHTLEQHQIDKHGNLLISPKPEVL